MNARKHLFTPLIFWLLLASPSLVGAQLNLDSCQAKAQQNYPMIMQFDLIEQSKELRLSNANKNFLPKLDINLIGGVVDGFPTFSPPGSEASQGVDFNLITIGQINQVIWDGGMTKASKHIIEANAEIEKADISIALYQLKDRINNLYFGVLLIDEQMEQLALLEKTLERNYKRVEVAVENGSAYRSDLDELMVEIINVAQKKEELAFNKKAYTHVLSLMIGEEINDLNVFTRPAFAMETDSLSIQRPELAKFQMQRQALTAKAKLDKAQLFPKIGLLGFGVLLSPGVEFGTANLTNLLVAGLSVSWSLDPLYKNGNNKKISEINLQRIQNHEETFLFNTNMELSQTELELEKFEKLIEQDREILKLKSSIKEAYKTKYDNGITTMSDMLDRINDETAAKQKMIMHEIHYLMKAYQYLTKSGN